MNDKYKPPCEGCITLGICRGIVEIDPTLLDIMEKCELIRNYLTQSFMERRVDNITNYKLTALAKVFKIKRR